MVLIVAAALLAVRYGALTPQGRLLIEARTSGLRLGRLGRLKLQGLDGDIWREFTVAKMTIADEKGVWLQADHVTVSWSYVALLRRRLQINQLASSDVRILRRPSLAPKGPASRGLPVTFDIRKIGLRVQTLPAFSARPGLYNLTGKLSLERGGLGQTGDLQAASLLHAGDRLDVRFDVGRTRPLLVVANAVEAKGGALAGALGLHADRPFSLSARAAGSQSAGRLDARLSSGDTIPLDAHGAWSLAGGSIAGRATLAASSLTAAYVPMIGPDAIIAIAARRAHDGRYGAALRLQARNLTLVAQGPADPTTLSSTEGLKLAAIVADVSRLTGQPGLGAGQTQGVLSGGPEAWRYLGSASLQRISLSGYHLGRLTGSVSIAAKDKTLDVRTSVTGAGGGGAGVIAGLIGASPKASVQLSRLADGRLLIRKADAQGSGLKLEAQGSRGLLGGLKLTGRIQVADLGVAHSGAAGSIDAKWTADQANTRAPWRFSADGRGAKFRSGLGELDRLLGPQPRVQVQAVYTAKGFEIGRSSIDGDKASISAAGRIDPHGAIALEAKWSAEGPFQAGPVQIAGKAKGEGTIAGTVAAPRADLNADFAAIDIPQLPLSAAHMHLAVQKRPGGADGQIALNASSEYGPARAAAAFRFVHDGLDLSAIDADAAGVKAQGALSLRGHEPSAADLHLAVGPGAVLTEGSIAGTLKIVDSAMPTATVELKATDARLRGSGMLIRTAVLSGSGPLARLPFQTRLQTDTPQGAITLTGAGTYEQANGVQQLALTGSGQFRHVDFHTLEPITLRIAGKDRTTRVRIALGGGRLEADARQTGEAVTATANLDGVDIKTLNEDFLGKIDAQIQLSGHGGQLNGTMNAKLDQARSSDAPADTAVGASVKAVLRDTQLELEAHAAGAKGMKADLSAVLPVEASAAPLHIAIVRNRPMRGTVTADGEVKPLWDLFYGDERELGGQVHLAGALGGTLIDPLLTGQASVTGGSLDDYGTGLKLSNLALSADLKRDVVTLSSFSAKDGKSGEISGSGSISLVRNGGSNLKLDLKRFRLLDNDTAEATATGPVVLTRGADGKIEIQGTLNIDRAQINAETKLRPSVVSMDVIEKNIPERLRRSAQPAASKAPTEALDVRLTAPGRVFVKGRGIDAELSVDAHVTGTVLNPVLEGSAQVVQGSYDFAGKRFEFDDRGSITLANAPERMRLDLSASWEAPTITATVQIRGTAAKPEITMTSSPSLPPEEIMSQVLFGASASQLSGAQTAELASTATALATGGGFDVLGSLKQFAGLDRLALGSDEISGMTVAGGKYINDNVYLEIVGGGRTGPSAEVDWRIRRGISLISQLGGEFGAKLSIRWSHDLGAAGTSQKQPAHK